MVSLWSLDRFLQDTIVPHYITIGRKSRYKVENNWQSILKFFFLKFPPLVRIENKSKNTAVIFYSWSGSSWYRYSNSRFKWSWPWQEQSQIRRNHTKRRKWLHRRRRFGTQRRSGFFLSYNFFSHYFILSRLTTPNLPLILTMRKWCVIWMKFSGTIRFVINCMFYSER